jgi:hypothetical protein
MKIYRILAAAAMAIAGIAISWAAADLSPKQILQQADEARGNLQGVEWKVKIHSVENDRIQERNLGVKARGYDFLALMKSPPKVKGQKLLMVSHNMWFRRPNLRKPVPVSPRQKLVGGASYGDVAATNYADDYTATVLADEVVDGERCYVFDLKASHKKATYDAIKYWVSQERLVGVKAEYYAVSGKLLKSARFEYRHQIRLRNRPHPFISKMTIVDALIGNSVTTLDFNDHRLVTVPPSTFDLNLF